MAALKQQNLEKQRTDCGRILGASPSSPFSAVSPSSSLSSISRTSTPRHHSNYVCEVSLAFAKTLPHLQPTMEKRNHSSEIKRSVTQLSSRGGAIKFPKKWKTMSFFTRYFLLTLTIHTEDSICILKTTGCLRLMMWSACVFSITQKKGELGTSRAAPPMACVTDFWEGGVQRPAVNELEFNHTNRQQWQPWNDVEIVKL